jgi:DNA-binding NarL/FixJ family response regulator
MFSDKPDLLTQINAIIQKTSFEEKHWNSDFSLLQKSMENAASGGNKNYFPFLKKNEIKKLEGRIKKLEGQNDQLICIVHFLFQKITGLVNGFWDPGQNKEEKLNCIVKKDKPLLTKREMDVFNLLAKGLCAKEIAKTLFISETTVITHKKNLKEKFKAKNTVELISNVLTKKFDN